MSTPNRSGKLVSHPGYTVQYPATGSIVEPQSLLKKREEQKNV